MENVKHFSQTHSKKNKKFRLYVRTKPIYWNGDYTVCEKLCACEEENRNVLSCSVN